tara:strand:+ start:416 stop:3193 length:2778 start_codon:yes stop_codon:yes gene_type:complete
MKFFILIFLFLVSCSNKDKKIENNFSKLDNISQEIELLFNDFKLSNYDDNATYAENSFEYKQIKKIFNNVLLKTELIENEINDNNYEKIYYDYLDKAYLNLIEIGYTIFDPRNDWSISYSEFLEDYDQIFENIYNFSNVLDVPRNTIIKAWKKRPYDYQDYIELILNNYSEVEDIINDFKNNDTLFYSAVHYYTMYDNTYNIVIGKLADTFNDLYRTAKSNKIFTDINFKQELEFNGFFINSAAAEYYATTSDYKNSNFYILKSIDYLNEMNFNNLSNTEMDSGINSKLFFVHNIHESLYSLYFNAIEKNSAHKAQRVSDQIYSDSLDEYFKKIKVLESLHNISQELVIPEDYLEENPDVDLFIKNNVIYLSRMNDYAVSNSFQGKESEYNSIGLIVGQYNVYNEEGYVSWIDSFYEDIYSILNNDSINEDEYFSQLCGTYEEAIYYIFDNVSIYDIQENPEAYFNHFTILRDAINSDCSDDIARLELDLFGLEYMDMLALFDTVLIDKINKVFSEKNDSLFLNYLFDNSIEKSKELAIFFNNYFKTSEGNFLITNVSESKNNTVESIAFYLITKSSNKSNSFDIFKHSFYNENEILLSNILYKIEDYNELIMSKADVNDFGRELFNFFIGPYKDYLSNNTFTLLVLDPSLQNIPFETLVDNDNYFFENTDIIRSHTLEDFISGAKDLYVKINSREQRVNNFQNLIGLTKSVIDPKILAFGDIDYLNENKKIIKVSRDNTLGYLPFTRKEISSINKIVRQSTTLSGKKASESYFKEKNLNDFSVIHFATHGLSFYNDFKKSSIILAGDKKNDGLLTYEEIFNIDLSSVDLVFLSACNTNLARNFRNISSPSIQQAFKSAGVNTVISTMWPINDLSTSLFVEIYYNEYMKTGLSFKALQNTRKIFIETYPEYNHPYYWAAFTQFGI